MAEIDLCDHENKITRQRVTSRASDLRQAKRSGQPSERASLLSKIRDKLVQYGKHNSLRQMVHIIYYTDDETQMRYWLALEN